MGDLKQFIAKRGLSQAGVARALGVSAAAISQYLKGAYQGDVGALEQRIQTYMANYLQKGASAIKITQTTDLQMVDFVCCETASQQEMGAIYGKAGTGKTVAIKAFAAKHPEAILIESMPMSTPKGLLIHILDKLGQRQAQGSFEALHKQAVNILRRSERILIIDEAENLTTKSLESVRRLHDFSGVPVILVGTYALLQNLRGRRGELLQIYSRIQNRHEMMGLTDEDRASLFGTFAQEIARYTDDARRSVSMFKKAMRFAQHDGVPMNAQHIQIASNTVILG